MTRSLEQLSDQSENWNDFSLMEGGPLYRLARTLRLSRGPSGFVYLGVAIALLTWMPLFALAAVTHSLTSGSTMPFLQSLGTHVRLLVAIPLMFVAEARF